MRSTLTRSITALILVIAMAVGMTASLGGKAQAAIPINIAYAAGDGATINGGQVYNVPAYPGKTTTITTVKPTNKTGYKFLGWSTIKNSGIVQYKPGETQTFTENTTLWPVWDTKCAILYMKDDAAENRHFQYDTPVFRTDLLNYLSARVSKASVFAKDFNSWDTLFRAWNSMPSDQAVVIINCHGYPARLYYSLNISDVTKKLAFKNIKVIILSACNCGHLEHKGTTENIAEVFARRFKCVVYASDGNLQAYTLASANRPEWRSYNTSNRTNNAGWVVYDGRKYKDSKIIPPETLGLKSGTTIGGLLDAYYSMHYSW